jgi:hypothetical protein
VPDDGLVIARLITQVHAWPSQRGLWIGSLQGDVLLHSGNQLDPFPVRVYRQDGHYYGTDQGQWVSVTNDGDAFFRALLISLGAEQIRMIDRLGLRSDRSESAVIAALRAQLSNAMHAQPMEVGRPHEASNAAR